MVKSPICLPKEIDRAQPTTLFHEISANLTSSPSKGHISRSSSPLRSTGFCPWVKCLCIWPGNASSLKLSNALCASRTGARSQLLSAEISRFYAKINEETFKLGNQYSRSPKIETLGLIPVGIGVLRRPSYGTSAIQAPLCSYRLSYVGWAHAQAKITDV